MPLSTSATTTTKVLRDRGTSLQNNMQTLLWTHNSKNLGNIKKGGEEH